MPADRLATIQASAVIVSGGGRSEQTTDVGFVIGRGRAGRRSGVLVGDQIVGTEHLVVGLDARGVERDQRLGRADHDRLGHVADRAGGPELQRRPTGRGRPLRPAECRGRRQRPPAQAGRRRRHLDGAGRPARRSTTSSPEKRVFSLIFISDLVSVGYRMAQQDNIPVIGAPDRRSRVGYAAQHQHGLGQRATSRPCRRPTPSRRWSPKSVGATNMAALAIANEEPSIIAEQEFHGRGQGHRAQGRLLQRQHRRSARSTSPPWCSP